MSGSFLYHGTGIYALAAIIESNCLNEGVHWGKPGEPHGPRLSRDYGVAKSFITYNLHWGEGGVLVFDRERLAKDYRIVSYTDTQYGGEAWESDEAEEVVLTPSLVDLSRYLVSIICAPHFAEIACRPENLLGAKDECGWAFEHADDALAIGALRSLARHSKLNCWLPEDGLPSMGNWQPTVERRISGPGM